VNREDPSGTETATGNWEPGWRGGSIDYFSGALWQVVCLRNEEVLARLSQQQDLAVFREYLSCTVLLTKLHKITAKSNHPLRVSSSCWRHLSQLLGTSQTTCFR